MLLNCQDTIAAIGTPQGAALRGVIRVSGPDAIECLRRCFSPDDATLDWQEIRAASRLKGRIHRELQIDCTLYLWPTERSYTREPAGEIHTLGSPPLLQAILRELCTSGARLAEPGEFTLRAFLAGRIDLTQAEAVLGVIDARGEGDFETSLQQLAGGLSRPLEVIRETLLTLLAELEAGLDFVEEDIEFITEQQVSEQLSDVQVGIVQIRDQMKARNLNNRVPRVVLMGLPNAGKSSLFNALKERYGRPEGTGAIVSEQPGTTRDYLSVQLRLRDLTCELVDTAGADAAVETGSIEQVAQEMTGSQHSQADLEIHCIDPTHLSGEPRVGELAGTIVVYTKVDLMPTLNEDFLVCSSKTGYGLEELCDRIYNSLTDSEEPRGQVVHPTALRCEGNLAAANESLARALRLNASQTGDELVAAEVRDALHQIGQVVGVVYTDDILDRIFGQFCIGK